MTYDPVARTLAQNAITMATIAEAEVHDAQVGALASAAKATSQANLASSKADMATGQALAAAASQTAAAQSAATATTQASIASAASTSASALLQSFRGVFMGALPTDAAANAFAIAQSIPLSPGVMYENTTSGKFRIWSGTAWGDYDATAAASQANAALAASQASASAATASAQAGIATTQATAAAAQAAAASASSTAAAGKSAHLDLWSDIGTKSFDAGVLALFTGGYAAAGVGAGYYVTDALATAALSAANPNLCRQSADGRYWRLMPTHGEIAVEQAGAKGDPTGTGLVNDQAAIQAAINYAATMGYRTVRFPQRQYAIWMPRRTTTFWVNAPDGQGLVIPAMASGDLILRGAGRTSRIAYYNIDGTSLATNWQTIAADSNPWRGSACYIVSPAVDPGQQYRPTVTFENLWLDGGTVATGNSSWANPVTAVPTGWDVSNKGIYVQPDLFSGDTILRNTRITGFRGELVYTSNMRDSRLILEGRVELGETNGQAINPAGGGILCPGYMVAWNVNFAFEGWAGMGNLRGEIHNILSSGSCLTGGVIDTTSSGNSYKPQRLTETPFAGQMSMFTLDLLVTSSQKTIYLGSFLRGRVVAVDTTVTVDGATIYSAGVIDSDLEIISMADKANLQTALAIFGGAATGSQTVSDCRYRLSIKRSRDAIAAGYKVIDAIIYGGSIGQDVIIERSSGPSQRGCSIYNNGTTMPDYHPVFRSNTFGHWTDFSTTSQSVSTTPAIVPRGDWMAINNAVANTTVSITLPTTGIGDGHELTLYNSAGPTGNQNIGISASGAGCHLPARRIIGGADSMKLRFDATQSLWFEVTPPKPISLQFGTLAIPAVAANGVSAVLTATVYGAEVGMSVAMTNMYIATSAIEICQVQVTANNTVSFRVRDVSGAGFAAQNLWVNIGLEWKRTWVS